jgi:putative peptidoglycan lipid II flippase
MNKSGAIFVAIGIFLSRIAGLVRERVFAHYFGNSDAGDAFKAALKIPNFLQNLFGEGVLSASFIPVYAKLISQNDEEESSRVAGTIFTLLMFVVSLLVLVGVLAAPWMIDAIAPGFHGEKRDLTVHLVQIFFPGLGFLVLSAWCLGVLNSHRKFFLSYFAPVIWNITLIAFLIYFGPKSTQNVLAVKVAWGLVLGSLLQFLIQLPTVMKLLKKIKFSLQTKSAHIQTVIKNFFPVVLSRGVVQVSAYIDNLLASFLPTGAVSTLAYTQTLYLLPVSLFGMSISAAELPAMSQAQGTDEEISVYLRERLNRGLRQIAFFIIPSVVAFAILGDVIASAIFQTGEFNHDSTIYVWKVLAGSTIGLLATTQGRLYSSTFYSLKDTRTPLRFAIVRVVLTTILGYLFALPIPAYFHLDPSWGTAGLTASAGLSGWVEFLLLKKSLGTKIGKTFLGLKYQMQLWTVALLGAMIAFFLKINYFQANDHFIIRAVIVLGIYGVTYLAGTIALGVPESQSFIRRFRKKRGG